MWGGDLTKPASFNVNSSWMLPQMSNGQTVLLPVVYIYHSLVLLIRWSIFNKPKLFHFKK